MPISSLAGLLLSRCGRGLNLTVAFCILLLGKLGSCFRVSCVKGLASFKISAYELSLAAATVYFIWRERNCHTNYFSATRYIAMDSNSAENQNSCLA